jgi:hypothetical protein
VQQRLFRQMLARRLARVPPRGLLARVVLSPLGTPVVALGYALYRRRGGRSKPF